MNEIFNLPRLGKVIKNELFSFLRYYLFYVIFAVSYALAQVLLSRQSGLHPTVFAYLSMFLVVIAPFMLYSNVFHRIKGVNYTMLPASNAEKWLAFWIQNVVVVPLLLGGLWLFLSFLNLVIYGVPISCPLDSSVELHALLLTVFGAQSVSMVGVMSFRNLKWLKTLGAIFVLQVVTLFISNLFLFQFDLKSFIVEAQTANVDPDKYSWLINYIKIVVHIVFPFGLWLVSFFKLQEQEL